METGFDIAICGAGPVGMALAGLLIQYGVAPARIALLDARDVEAAAADPRAIALSYGSRQLLESIGAWPIVAHPIEQIHVSRRGHFGRTLIDRADHGLPALGYVTRYGALVAALDAALARVGIVPIRPARVMSFEESADAVALHLDTGADDGTIAARIAVQAEGGVFGEHAAKPATRDYGQTAIVAHVAAGAPQPQRAYERFTDEGPLALLPQDDGYALVWCVRPDTALQLSALGDDAFLAALQRAFGDRLGRFLRTGPRRAYPLGLTTQAAATARTVAIGNAAQTLHPVAGQGLNLGLRDAAVLARTLSREASPAALRQFLAARRPDRNLTVRLTDALARVFVRGPGNAWPQPLLGTALALTDLIPPAKQALAEQMMFGRR
ncbi:MAG: UbiH/UbiF/VisC/COQ6 family ubiquinone biosynthesis hydroxylase [Burkholderiaceae bacterium]